MGTVTAEQEAVATTGAAFVDFWTQQAAKGELNENTANSLRAAVKAVLEVEEGWEALDVRTIEVERFLRRFAHKKANDLKSDSIRAYQRRFEQALRSFLSFAEDPAAWKPPAQSPNGTSKPKAERKAPREPSQAPEEVSVGAAAAATGSVDYPFALRGGQFIARLRLPVDLTQEEVRRLSGFLSALAVE